MTRPLVYLGPSLPAADALAALPSAELRPPVRRGDLRRDWRDGARVFLIVDGVFWQDEAVSPREIVDVLRAGALVVGASSMGALRAAECWPAGMRGVGAIYRLFRRGTLTSDDEVAVLFDPADPARARPIPLVNVRYSVWKAVRHGQLPPGEGDRVIQAAQALHFSERTYRAILAGAGLGGERERLGGLLAAHDLKREDALRALRRVGRGWEAAPAPAGAADPERDSIAQGEIPRERRHDALAGLDPRTTARALARAHLLDGRYMRHALAMAALDPARGLAERLRSKAFAASLVGGALARKARYDDGARGASAQSALALRLVVQDLWRELMKDEDVFADRLWTELRVLGELEAEIFRLRALRQALERARALGLTVLPLDRHVTRTAIARAHGFGAWTDFVQVASAAPWPLSDFLAHADDRALALQARARSFERPRED